MSSDDIAAATIDLECQNPVCRERRYAHGCAMACMMSLIVGTVAVSNAADEGGGIEATIRRLHDAVDEQSQMHRDSVHCASRFAGIESAERTAESFAKAISRAVHDGATNLCMPMSLTVEEHNATTRLLLQRYVGIGLRFEWIKCGTNTVKPHETSYLFLAAW